MKLPKWRFMQEFVNSVSVYKRRKIPPDRRYVKCVYYPKHTLSLLASTHIICKHTHSLPNTYIIRTHHSQARKHTSQKCTLLAKTHKLLANTHTHTLLAWPHTSRNTHTIIKHTQYLQTHTYIACIAEKDATQILSSLHHNFINYRCMFSMFWHIRLRSTFSECILWIADYFDNMSISDGQGMGFLQKFIKQMTNGKE